MLCLIAVELLPMAHSDEPAEWVTKSFTWLSRDLVPVTTDDKSSPLPVAALPKDDATKEEWERSVRNSTATITRALTRYLGPFPEGTVTLYDPATETLAIRTTRQKMTLVNVLASHLESKHPWQPAFTVHVVEADESVVREILQETLATAFHDAAWAKLESLVEKKEAAVLGQLRLPTRSGQRVRAEAGTEFAIPISGILDEQNSLKTETEASLSGLLMEVDPVIGRYGGLLDVNFAFSWNPSPPVHRLERMSLGDHAPTVSLPMVDARETSATSSILMAPGHSRLISVCKGAPDRPGRLQCAFLTAEKLPTLRHRNDSLPKLLTAYASPPPTSAPTGASRLPDDMKLGVFDVPRSFLQLDQPSAGTFNSAEDKRDLAPASALPDPASAQRILMAQGIMFPPGSFALHHPRSSFLIVANHQRNLDMVEAFVSGFGGYYPVTLNFELTIIEAEGPLLRELAREASHSADHTALWKKMQGLPAVKWLNSARLETRSGYRSSFKAGVTRQCVTALNTDTPKPSDEKDQPPSETKVKTENELPPKTNHGRTLVYESTPTGFRWEVDPVITPLGHTSEVNLTFTYHYAPPTPIKETSATHLPIPHLEHHAAEFSLSTNMAHGTTRWLATWKPTGSPEHEGRDILQAAFLTLNLLDPDPHTETP
jgi:hypothetical protein